MTLGIAVASAASGAPNASTFGTAQTLIETPGNTAARSAQRELARACSRTERTS